MVLAVKCSRSSDGFHLGDKHVVATSGAFPRQTDFMSRQRLKKNCVAIAPSLCFAVRGSS